jgi:LPXTG-site transpeptidase (sortase) family protein
MKRNLLIPIGLIIILIALVNSLIDFRLFSLDNTKVVQSKLAASINQLESNGQYISKEEYGADNIGEINKLQPDNQNGLLEIESEASKLENETGFIPLQLEKIKNEANNNDDELSHTKPVEIIINSVKLDAPIVASEQKEIIENGKTYTQWSAPDKFAAGWQSDSAYLGEIGNTVINGHHNVFGEVFKDLHLLKEGERVIINGDDGKKYTYLVTNVMILPERDVLIEQRLENARWMMPSLDERLTLITCWPSYSNTHRLIIVAKPESAIFINQVPEK